MEVKKSPKADLENKKTTNLLIGAILTLAVMFVGFEWSEREKKVTANVKMAPINRLVVFLFSKSALGDFLTSIKYNLKLGISHILGKCNTFLSNKKHP